MSDQDGGFHDEMLDDMLGDFIDESEGLIGQLNDNLLTLDEWVKSLGDQKQVACDPDLLNEMFRAAHSIKGLSAMMRLSDINVLTHNMENVFDAARQEKLFITSEVVELIFEALDVLGSMISSLSGSDHGAEVDAGPISLAIQEFLKSNGAEKQMGQQHDIEKALDDIQQSLDAAAEDEDTPMIDESPFEQLVDDQDIQPNFLSIFIDETVQSVDDLSDMLLGERDDKTVESLLVTCHRIKGSAASIGLHRPAKLAHLMEDVLQDLLSSQGDLSGDVTDSMLACTESLRGYVEALKSGETFDDNFAATYTDLYASHHTPGSQSADSNNGENAAQDICLDPPSSPQEQIQSLFETFAESSKGCVAEIQFEQGLMLVDLKARLVLERANDIGRVLRSEPSEIDIEQVADTGRICIAIETPKLDEQLQNKLRLEGVQSVIIHRVEGPASSSPTEVVTPEKPAELTPVAPAESEPPTPQTTVSEAAPAPTAESNTPAAAPTPTVGRAKPAETLRVDIDRLDQLMNLAGQLVINKARFVQISTGLRPLNRLKQMSHSLSESFAYLDRIDSDIDISNDELEAAGVREEIKGNVIQLRDDLNGLQSQINQLADIRGLIGDLSEAVHQLDRVADGIQKSVMDTRMVPIGPLFSRFKRVVRDLTKTSQKDVHLEIRGEKTELDKCMIDKLGDPLIHMVRNSVDHGIESPAARESAGKPAKGTVSLNAFHRGNRIFIQIKDDGGGLSPEKIQKKAIEKGIVSAADAEKLTKQQIFQLIWEPGFSTAEKVTEVSGRGMGMDIVRSKIEELSGTVDVESEPGEGTCFTIRLPLTMAILPSLLAEIAGDVFAIPVESVVEIIRVQKSELSTVRGQVTAMVRGRVVSIVTLDELFTWHQKSLDSSPASDDVTLVVVGTDDREVGLLVHGLIGEQDIVIKSLAENYQNVSGIAGASILGNGRVSLILDVGALLELSCRPRKISTLSAELDAMQPGHSEAAKAQSASV